MNRRPRAYHSGDSDEIDWILRRLQAANSGRQLHAAGVSLGGNALLKWAGERGAPRRAVVTGVAGICAPLDLAACGHHLARGFNRVYTQHFLKTLKPFQAARLRRFPGLFDEAKMRRRSISTSSTTSSPHLSTASPAPTTTGGAPRPNPG
jgi:predicted alpha/beta-fold hydrolase